MRKAAPMQLEKLQDQKPEYHLEWPYEKVMTFFLGIQCVNAHAHCFEEVTTIFLGKITVLSVCL